MPFDSKKPDGATPPRKQPADSMKPKDSVPIKGAPTTETAPAPKQAEAAKRASGLLVDAQKPAGVPKATKTIPAATGKPAAKPPAPKSGAAKKPMPKPAGVKAPVAKTAAKTAAGKAVVPPAPRAKTSAPKLGTGKLGVPGNAPGRTAAKPPAPKVAGTAPKAAAKTPAKTSAQRPAGAKPLVGAPPLPGAKPLVALSTQDALGQQLPKSFSSGLPLLSSNYEIYDDDDEGDLLPAGDTETLAMQDEAQAPAALPKPETQEDVQSAAKTSSAGKRATKKTQKKRKKRKKYKEPSAFSRGVSRLFAPLTNTALAHFFGNMFYSLGFFAECIGVRVWRVLRTIGGLVGQLLVWIFGGLFKGVKRVAMGFGRDLIAPFRRLRRGFGNIRGVFKEERQKGFNHAARTAMRYLRSGVKAYSHLVSNLLGFLLPLAAVVALTFTVNALLSMEYALAVELNGKVLGYVEDQSVLEDAKSMLRGRLKLGKDQSVSDWQFNPNLSIGRAMSFTSKQHLVNEILKDQSFDVVQATGLYIGEDLFAVTTEGAALKKYLDSRLAEYYDPENPDAEITFVSKVECEPNTDDVFLTSSVRDYDELVQELSSVRAEERRYTTLGEENLSEIAHKNNITFAALQQRNPALAEMAAEDVAEPGMDLLISSAQPFLQVQKTFRRARQREVEYKTVENETDEYLLGIRRGVQDGVNGLEEIFEDFTYIDGELISTVPVEELTRIITPVQDEIIDVGTHKYTVGEVTVGFQKYYINPVPQYTYSSRGMAGGHRGRDINAPTGTPIVASNAGVVITAEFHYSYGNYVMIQHDDGLVTLYAHCSALNVNAGDVVNQGEQIALVGSTGNSSGPHCHLEFQMNGSLVNPDEYIPPNYTR